MSWTRLDDTWTDLPELSALDHQVRWHYLAMIQFCSRTKRFDGILRLADARRCSDVDEPAAAISTLVEAQLLMHLPSNLIKVSRIDDHIPPPSVRENSERSKIRMQRHRKHKNGDHSECLPENCEHAKEKPAVDTQTGEVTGPVTRNTRTGQDRTGQDYEASRSVDSERHNPDSSALDDGSPLGSDPTGGSADPFAWFDDLDREAS